MRISCLALLLALGFAPATVNATTLTMVFGDVFDGPAPAGDAPWLTATFEDVTNDPIFCGAAINPDCVRLTLDATNLVADYSVLEWYFNTDPTFTQASDRLLFGFVSGPNALGGVNWTDGGTLNAFQAGGDGYFDIKFNFLDAFTGGSTSVFKIIDQGKALDVSAFDFLSCDDPVLGCGSGTWYSAAKIQGSTIWLGGVKSDGVVPEPTTLLLFATGLAAAEVKRHRRR